MDFVELLSPAGEWNALKAAVSGGADAVYFGVAGAFNARMRAENFKEKELPQVVSFCHTNGILAYLAVNTLVKNNELEGFFALLKNAYSSGVDAVIIQDISFIEAVKNAFPDMRFHVSTQASVFNSLYGRLLSGADRVILPREFTLKQVREFREKTGLDIEVFIQGALCFSVSGQCLLSSFLGGRSANRGLCAQPCRKKYNGGFVLSTRDLCLAGKIPDLIAAGVSSLKIEGRLRDARYVSCATTLYRRVIDSFYSGKYGIDPDALMDMRLAFSREYTEGMLARIDDVVTPDAGGKRGALLGRLGKDGALRLNEQVRVGDGVGILTGKGVHGDVIRAIERCGRKVSFAGKGDTVRLFLNAKEGDEIVLTSGVARRKPYKIPKRKPLLTRKAKPHEISLDIKKKGLAGRMLLVKVYSRKDASKAREAGADRVYYNVFSKDYPMDDRSVNPYVPRCLSEWNAQKALKTLEHLDPNSVLSGDAGLACSLAGREVFLDMSGNVFNDVAVGFYNARGVIPVVSPELSFKELSEFRDKRFCVYAHGRIALMSTKYALPDESLLDEKGYVFPVRTELDMRQVLNSVPLGLFDGIRKLEGYGISRYLLDLSGDVSETVAAYRKIMQGSDDRKTKEGYTLGNYRAGVL